MDLKLAYKDRIRWHVLSERALLLQLHSASLTEIQDLAHSLSALKDLESIVPAYDSLALIFNNHLSEPNRVIDQVLSLPLKKSSRVDNTAIHELPICYDLGDDLDLVLRHLQMNKLEFIHEHSKTAYTIAMCGFLPGFLYLDGMQKELTVPRMEKPRLHVPKGAVGIGGVHTGIYSLPSPGGWNIVGRTPITLFDVANTPPMRYAVGEKIRFVPIDVEQYNKLSTHD